MHHVYFDTNDTIDSLSILSDWTIESDIYLNYKTTIRTRIPIFFFNQIRSEYFFYSSPYVKRKIEREFLESLTERSIVSLENK